MSKKVLAIVGSPRKNGNTDLLLNVILDGAKSAGAQTEKIYLADFSIENCRECLHCHSGGAKVCAINDDMAGIAEKMREADVLVFGTPIFWWGPTGAFKTFMDRWYGYELGFPEKKLIFAYPSGDPDVYVSRFLRGIFEASLDYMGTKAFAFVPAAGAHDPGDVNNMTDVLENAKQVGYDSVK